MLYLKDSVVGKPLLDFDGLPVKVNATDADVDPRYNKVNYGIFFNDQCWI